MKDNLRVKCWNVGVSAVNAVRIYFNYEGCLRLVSLISENQRGRSEDASLVHTSVDSLVMTVQSAALSVCSRMTLSMFRIKTLRHSVSGAVYAREDENTSVFMRALGVKCWRKRMSPKCPYMSPGKKCGNQKAESMVSSYTANLRLQSSVHPNVGNEVEHLTLLLRKQREEIILCREVECQRTFSSSYTRKLFNYFHSLWNCVWFFFVL